MGKGEGREREERNRGGGEGKEGVGKSDHKKGKKDGVRGGNWVFRICRNETETVMAMSGEEGKARCKTCNETQGGGG